MSETYEQIKYFNLVRDKAKTDPRYLMIGSTANGAHLAGKTQQERGRNCNKLKAAGLPKGYPDIFCNIPNQFFHGLFIELKFGENEATDDQEAWIARLLSYGNYATVCYGAEEAWGVTGLYLESPASLLDVPQAQTTNLVQLLQLQPLGSLPKVS